MRRGIVPIISTMDPLADRGDPPREAGGRPIGRPSPDGPASGGIQRDRSAEQDADLSAEEVTRAFWLSHMRIGFCVFLAEGLVVAEYLSRTPGGAHRNALWAMTVTWLAGAIANLVVLDRVATKPWRQTFSIGWTVLSAAAVAGVAILDGGIGSPFVFLFFLPIGYTAWAFSPSSAAMCNLATVGSAAVVVVLGRSGGPSGSSVMMLFAVLGGAAVLSLSAARNRARREAREAVLAARVEELASIDTLTGCVVRRVFHERLHIEVSRSQRSSTDLSLVMVDVDHFKRVNDTYGHLVGDQVIARIGQILRSTTRAVDVVGRLGGDEFAVLLPDTDIPRARLVAQRVQDEVGIQMPVEVTLSVGISRFEGVDGDAEQLLDDADFALYQVKRGSRNGIAVRDPGAHAVRQRDSSGRR